MPARRVLTLTLTLTLTLILILTLSLACTGQHPGSAATPASALPPYDLIISNGQIVDGTGNPWFQGDLAVIGDRIVRIAPAGFLAQARAGRRIDATGLVVAPGFIDIQAQSYEQFLTGDGRVLGMITQGITTAILGEGSTPAPVTPALLAEIGKFDTSFARVARDFTGEHGFGNWLDAMARHGASQNMGSFLGAATVRVYAKGEAQGEATPAELDTMRAVVRNAMRDGAFGVGSALIYPPASYASTAELVAQAEAMSPFGGVYITHLRSEGDRYLEAIDEALEIGRRGHVPVEIYHLKAAGVRNWGKASQAIARIDSARAAGQDIGADMYAYVAGATSLAACVPPWASENGKLIDNLKDATTRARIVGQMHDEHTAWESLCQLATPPGVQVVGFARPELKKYEGMRLAAIADDMKKDWADALIDITIAEQARTGALFFIIKEENVPLQMRQPWMKFGTDADGQDPDSAKGMTHPRSYGNYPRILGRYVREQRVMPIEEAVRKMTSAVANRLSIRDRGLLREGMYADVVVFDPNTIIDRATFEKPHQLSVGMREVLVNGVEVIRDGAHTGAKPGRLVHGPGWTGGGSAPRM